MAAASVVQVLPRISDSAIEKKWMDGNDVIIQQTSFNKCMPEIKDVSKLFWYLLATIPVLQKHRKFQRMRGCNYSFIIKRSLLPYEWLQWNCESALKKGMTASARFKETQ